MADDILVGIQPDLAKIAKGVAGIEKIAQEAGQNFGNKLGDAAEKATDKAMAGLLRTVLKVTAVIGTGFAFKKMIDNAREGEEAVNRLNTSLKLAGTFSEESSQRMQKLANSLQQTSIYNSDVILGQIALARNMTRTNEEAEKLTKAAIDLSAATGMSLDSAVKNLGKTFAGMTGELGESLPALRSLTPAALRAGEALDFVIQRFGGASEAMMNTFGGSMSMAENNFKTLLKELGNLVTQSPVVVAFIKEISNAFKTTADSVAGIGKSGDVIGDLIKKFLELARVLTEWVLPPLELLYNTGEVIFRAMASMIQDFLIVPLSAIGNIIGKIGVATGAMSQQTADALAMFNQTALETSQQLAGETTKAFNEMYNFDAALASSNFVTRMQAVADAARPVTEEFKNQIQNAIGMNTMIGIGESFSLVLEGMADAAADFNQKASENFRRMGQTMLQSFGNAAGQAFAAFGKAVAKGENALKAFLNSLLASFGQAMIQMGTMYILQGIAATWAYQPNGPPLIAAGAALAAFGGVLSALGGGGGSAGGGGGAGASGGGSTSPSTKPELESGEDVAALEPRKPETNITVQVQGNILDRRQTGLELAEVIQETFGTNGVNYNTA